MWGLRVAVSAAPPLRNDEARFNGGLQSDTNPLNGPPDLLA
jgi:hypothetical protein